MNILKNSKGSGISLTQVVVAIVAFSQGVQHLADISIQYLYKDEFKLSPAKMGLYMGISSLPWIIKPIWGVVTDSFPIFGSRRKAYLLIFGCISGSGWILMSYFGEHSPMITILLLTIISTSVCVCNVVGEALMVAESSDASTNVSIFFGFKAMGGIISAYFSGQLLMTLTKSQRPVLLILAFMMSPSSSSIMFYFYTEVLHFTPNFMGQLKFMYCMGSLLAILIYKTYLQNIKFQNIFITTTIMYFVCYLTTTLLVTRKNVELGIPDKFFCLGDSVMLQFVGELNMLPILVFACKICPKNIEATMYAMLMATINLGQLMGGQIGNLILYGMGINEHNFTDLWKYIIFTSLFLVVTLPWAHLIREPKEKLVDEDDGDDKQQLLCD